MSSVIREEIVQAVSRLHDPSNRKPISEYLKNSFLSHQTIPYEKGVYAFWLDNRDKKAKNLHRSLQIKGRQLNKETIKKNKKDEKFEMHQVLWDWNLDDDFILLYVGKSSRVSNRIAEHLKLGTKKWKVNPLEIIKPKNITSCQLRSGIQHLCQVEDARPFIINNVHLSIVEELSFEMRFYIEDSAIGQGMPWFNLDSER
ncbi:hypothetical protein [Marinoscillum sp.]|uniref:hypothetical protein n=1 Tax=Marinoscillum sp. TaxID=2024838 RepID=UPI003BAD2834